LGFSKTSDPTDFSTAVGHGWCGYSYATGKLLEDYDKLGLDSSHIMIGSNLFEAKSGAFLTAHVLSLPKPASGKIETCPGAPPLTTFGSKLEPLRTSVENHLASTPEPATVADESPSGFVLAADEATPFSGNGSHLMIWQVAGTAEKPELKALGAPAVTAFALPPNVPQPGSTDRLDSLDSRLTQAVAAADPGAGGAQAVWTQQTIAGGAGSVVRWYELLPGKLEVKQAGTISDPSMFVFNGAIAPTISGGAVINYNTASSSARVQIMAQSRVGTDPAGAMNAPIALASSAAIDSDFSCPSFEPKSTACRWGDYAGASVDPTNSNVVWGSSQVNAEASTEHQARWATQNFALTPQPTHPHYYSEGALVGSAPRADVAWGTITLANVKGGSPGSFITCHSAGAGTLLNPESGGAGEGLTQVFATFACESQGICLAGESSALVAEELPWHHILTEEVVGTVRQESTGIKVLIECLVGEKVESVHRFLTGAGQKGLRPSSHVGTSALHPGLFSYDAGSGELEAEGSSGAITRRAEGAVKILGFDAQELISIVNP
jgi:hypothetical protein